MIHNSSQKVMTSFKNFVNKFSDLWIDQDFVNLSVENWIKISLKTNWEDKIKDKAKVYSTRTKDKKFLNQIFDKLHQQHKLSWINQSTLFFFSCFVIWRESSDQKKNRIVVDIRELNAVVQSNAYLVSFQTNILTAVSDCNFISIIDCLDFFYQWRIHSSDRHKLTVITHRDQKSFNVVVMNYRNSSTYVQKQIDRILRNHQHFVRAYVNDIVIFSKTLQKHKTHLKKIFDVLSYNSIFINSTKKNLNFSSINLLKQHLTSLRFFTDKQKLRTIANLTFLKNLSQLETYLRLIEWFRQYIEYYASKSEFLQVRKTRFLKLALKTDNVRKTYTVQIKFRESSNEELKFFETIQKHLFESIYYCTLIFRNNYMLIWISALLKLTL